MTLDSIPDIVKIIVSFLSKLVTEKFPHEPSEVREALVVAKYDRKKAAAKLDVTPDDLWEFINSPHYMRYMREAAHVSMLQMLEQSSKETQKNIETLCEIRDNAEKDRERIMAIKAMEDIFAEYKLPASPVESTTSSDAEERKQAAFERVREALRNAGPPANDKAESI